MSACGSRRSRRLHVPEDSRWWPETAIRVTRKGARRHIENGAEFAPGKVRQAFSLNGIDDYIEIPIRTPTPQSPLRLWFKAEPSNHPEPMSRPTTNDLDGWQIEMEPDGKMGSS